MPKFCEHCGAKIDEGTNFCDICGKKLEPSPAERNTQAAQPRQYAQQPAAPMPPQPPKKSNAIAITIIIAAAAVVIAAGTLIALFVFPGFLKSDNNQNGEASTTEAIVTTSAFEGTTEEITEEPTTEEPTTEEPTTVEPTTVQPTTVKPTVAPTTKEPDPTIDVNNVGKPKVNDFGWFVGKTDFSAPKGAAILKKADQVNGTWKGIIDYYGNSTVVLLDNFVISADGTSVSVTIKPYQVKTGSGYQSDDGNSTVYDGSFTGGTIDAMSVNGRLTIDCFYEQNGRQYATGTFMNPSGETAHVGLVRP